MIKVAQLRKGLKERDVVRVVKEMQLDKQKMSCPLGC